MSALIDRRLHRRVRCSRLFLCIVLAGVFLIPALLQAQGDTLLQGSPLLPQVPDTASALPPPINMTRLAVVGGVTAIGVTAIHLYQQNAWWKDHRGKFHFEEDLIYAKGVDKLGHLYGANVLTFVFSRSLQWAEVPHRPSLLWGAVASTLFQTYVEVEDGFSKYWGFDRVDFATDIAGAWYPVLQEYVPFSRNFNFKFSYVPKNPDEPTGIPGQTRTIFDDYEGQTIWLSANVKNLLPDDVSAFWPEFLCLSVGVSVRDNSSPNRYMVWYIAPDLDFRKIIPSDTWFLKTLGEALNFIHFPMPAIRIAPDVIWYGLYF